MSQESQHPQSSQLTTQPTTQLTTVAEGKYIRLVKQGKWEFAQRKGVSGIVAIVAVTDDSKLVLVEQFPDAGREEGDRVAGRPGRRRWPEARPRNWPPPPPAS